MENQNKDVAANVAANVEEERMHPIFEECEVMNAGKPAREHMLSLNGIYISGITDEQLKEMHEKLTELLTGGEATQVLLCRGFYSSQEWRYTLQEGLRGRDGWRQVPAGGCPSLFACIFRGFQICGGSRFQERPHLLLPRDQQGGL